jgi:hypothetical protein
MKKFEKAGMDRKPVSGLAFEYVFLPLRKMKKIEKIEIAKNK